MCFFTSEVTTDIPIPIAGVIISIQRKDAGITAIIRVTAYMNDTTMHNLRLYLAGEATTDTPKPKVGVKSSKQRKDAGTTAMIRVTAHKNDTIARG